MAIKSLTLEKALSRLLGLMGTRVRVIVVSEEPPGVLATFEGELSTGGEMEHVAYPAGNEAFVFRLGGDQASSFVLERRMLRRAFLVQSTDERPHSLRFYLGVGAVLEVNPVERGAPEPWPDS